MTISATVYGKGVYFARDAEYSAHAIYAVPGKSALVLFYLMYESGVVDVGLLLLRIQGGILSHSF